MNKEIALDVQSKFSSLNDPEVMKLKLQIDQIKAQKKSILNAIPVNNSSRSSDKNIFIPLDSALDQGLDLVRMEREFKIQEALFEFLVQKYELAKINEIKNTPTITIIDRAIAPQIKSKPMRKLIVLLATSIVFFLGVISCIIWETVKRNQRDFQVG
jgi:capsule polysaccharide export protein KpsE/RkpR